MKVGRYSVIIYNYFDMEKKNNQEIITSEIIHDEFDIQKKPMEISYNYHIYEWHKASSFPGLFNKKKA